MSPMGLSTLSSRSSVGQEDFRVSKVPSLPARWKSLHSLALDSQNMNGNIVLRRHSVSDLSQPEGPRRHTNESQARAQSVQGARTSDAVVAAHGTATGCGADEGGLPSIESKPKRSTTVPSVKTCALKPEDLKKHKFRKHDLGRMLVTIQRARELEPSSKELNKAMSILAHREACEEAACFSVKELSELRIAITKAREAGVEMVLVDEAFAALRRHTFEDGFRLASNQSSQADELRSRQSLDRTLSKQSLRNDDKFDRARSETKDLPTIIASSTPNKVSPKARRMSIPAVVTDLPSQLQLSHSMRSPSSPGLDARPASANVENPVPSVTAMPRRRSIA